MEADVAGDGAEGGESKERQTATETEEKSHGSADSLAKAAAADNGPTTTTTTTTAPNASVPVISPLAPLADGDNLVRRLPPLFPSASIAAASLHRRSSFQPARQQHVLDRLTHIRAYKRRILDALDEMKRKAPGEVSLLRAQSPYNLIYS